MLQASSLSVPGMRLSRWVQSIVVRRLQPRELIVIATNSMKRGILPSAARALVSVALAAECTLAPAAVEAAGPWKARIVDADTRGALEGVVVLAVWQRHVSGHPPIPL